MNVVIYKRLSKEDKKRTQHGFDSQQADIDFYLSSLENVNKLGEFQEFVSGGADHKPELEKAMDLCKELNATLVVAKLDRLSRRVSQVASYMESNINFKVATLPQADNFQLHIYASLAEQERTMIRDRVKRGLAAAKRKGVLLGGQNTKWQESYQSGKMNHIAKSRHQNSQQTWESKRVQIEAVISMMKNNNIKMTYKNIAKNFECAKITTPTGKSNWNSGQCQRALDVLSISR